jgi:hypothetical protein
VTGVMDPGEATLGSDDGWSSGMLMGKFRVNRFVCRVPGWARSGSDDRFCSDEDRESVVCSEAGSGRVGDECVVRDASGTEPWTRSPVPGKLSMVGQPAGEGTMGEIWA